MVSYDFRVNKPRILYVTVQSAACTAHSTCAPHKNTRVASALRTSNAFFEQLLTEMSNPVGFLVLFQPVLTANCQYRAIPRNRANRALKPQAVLSIIAVRHIKISIKTIDAFISRFGVRGEKLIGRVTRRSDFYSAKTRIPYRTQVHFFPLKMKDSELQHRCTFSPCCVRLFIRHFTGEAQESLLTQAWYRRMGQLAVKATRRYILHMAL